MKSSISRLSLLLVLAVVPTSLAQLTGFENKGLVAAGRLSGNLTDALGPGVDTLGGIFSGMAFEVGSWESVSGGVAVGGVSGAMRGRLRCAPDRNVGTVDFHPRVHTLGITVTPYAGTAAVGQTQIVLTVEATQVLTTDGTTFLTGATGNDLAQPQYPQSTVSSVGQGRRSVDCEGLTLMRDGGYFISDEYGTMVYRFDAAGVLLATLRPPEAWIPRTGATYGSRVVDYSGNTTPTTGRKSSSGLEGVAVSPDETRLFTILQSPLIQDSGSSVTSRNTRLLVYDIEPGSATRYQAVADYVYRLTLSGNETGTRQTLISDLTAVNGHQLIALERDARGRNGATSSVMTYKKLVLIDTDGATNLIGTGYERELGAPGQLSLPAGTLPSTVVPVTRQALVDMLDSVALAKFGLNLKATDSDTNTLAEKWEGLTVMPLNDAAFPDDVLLLVGCDNDFRAATVYHNGVEVGTNSTVTDHMILAWRVTLPGLAYNAVPELRMEPRPTGVRLSWPHGYPHYDLQSTTSLAAGSWSVLTGSGAERLWPWSGSTEERRFFRLRERR
jgi:hypothetical protein